MPPGAVRCVPREMVIVEPGSATASGGSLLDAGSEKGGKAVNKVIMRHAEKFLDGIPRR